MNHTSLSGGINARPRATASKWQGLGHRHYPHHHALKPARSAVPAPIQASRADTLRDLLASPGIHIGPCCHDGISARLIERAGFPFSFMSGFCTAAARLGAPDTGLISYAEMLDQGRYVNEATRHIPIIGDGDTGYGNALNVKRTVRGYAQAGFAGILIEDQVAPKSCGHVRGKRVVGREEAVSRIRAASDAKSEGADICVVARTDSRQASASLQEALWRAAAFADAGADVLFIDALESVEEMRAFCKAAPGVPKMANMLEGGGKTPILTPRQLEDLGFKIVAYPLSLLGVSIRAMERALEGLREGRIADPRDLGTFAEIQAAVGFPEYFEQEARYAVSNPWPGIEGAGKAAGSSSPSPAVVVEADQVLEASTGSNTTSSSSSSLLAPSRPGPGQDSSSSSSASSEGAGSSSGSSSLRGKHFRVRISDSATKMVKLETRIPAGFLAGLDAILPQVNGFSAENLLRMAAQRNAPPAGEGAAEPLAHFTNGGDTIQIFLE